MKNLWGGSTNYEMLSATTVFFLIINRCLLRNYFESVLKVSKILKSLEFMKNVGQYVCLTKKNCQIKLSKLAK